MTVLAEYLHMICASLRHRILELVSEWVGQHNSSRTQARHSSLTRKAPSGLSKTIISRKRFVEVRFAWQTGRVPYE